MFHAPYPRFWLLTEARMTSVSITFLSICAPSVSASVIRLSYEEHPITICGQTVILTNGELAAALLSLPEKNREIIFLYFFGHYTQREANPNCRH